MAFISAWRNEEEQSSSLVKVGDIKGGLTNVKLQTQASGSMDGIYMTSDISINMAKLARALSVLRCQRGGGFLVSSYAVKKIEKSPSQVLCDGPKCVLHYGI